MRSASLSLTGLVAGVEGGTVRLCAHGAVAVQFEEEEGDEPVER